MKRRLGVLYAVSKSESRIDDRREAEREEPSYMKSFCASPNSSWTYLPDVASDVRKK